MIRRLLKHLQNHSYLALDSRDAYAKWAQDYPPTPHNVLMQIEQGAMLSLMPTLQDKCVLDLACGTGRYGLIAQEQGARLVIGVDDSIDMLKQSPLIYLASGSMAQIPLVDASVDVVICGLAVGHFPDLDAILNEIARVLADGGYAVISDFHPFQYLTGARRTFTRDNVTYEVEHYPHLYQTVYDASTKAGLSIQGICEPTIDGQLKPVVLVYQLRKD